MENKIIIGVRNSTTATIDVISDNEDDVIRPLNLLYISLSYYREDAKFNWAVKNGLASPMVYFFNRNERTFPLGLVSKVHKILKENTTGYKIELTKDLINIFTPPYGKFKIEDLDPFIKSLKLYNYIEGCEIVPRDYQLKLVHEALNTRRCCLMAATGSGKSLNLYIITRYMLEKENSDVLLIVPSMGLVNQLYSDFENDYGWKEIKEFCSPLHSQIKDGKLTKKQKEQLAEINLSEDSVLKRVVITTWQTLQHKEDNFFKRFKAIIIDETHVAKADVLQKILSLCTNSTLKVGVSGTIPEDDIAAALIEGALGAKKTIIRSKELIDRGILTKVEIISILLPYEETSKKLLNRHDYDGQMALANYNSSKRDLLRLLIESKQIRPNENTIILFKNVDTLQNMKLFFEKNYPEFKSVLYYGDVDSNERESLRKQLEDNGGHLVFGSYATLKQGINIKRLHNVFLAESSKSLIMIIQSIGRGLRLHEDKTVCRVFDPVDDCSYWTIPRKGNPPHLKLNFAMTQYETRQQYYRDEEFPIIQYTAPFMSSVSVSDTEGFREIKAEKRKKKTKTPPKEKPSSKAGFFEID